MRYADNAIENKIMVKKVHSTLNGCKQSILIV